MASCYEVIAIEKALDASCHSIFHPESTNEHLSIDYLYLQIGLNKCCCQIWHNNLVRYHRIWCIFHSWQKSRINVVVLVAKIQVQPVSFCLKILNISRLAYNGKLLWSQHLLRNFQTTIVNPFLPKFQVPLQMEPAWIQNFKKKKWNMNPSPTSLPAKPKFAGDTYNVSKSSSHKSQSSNSSPKNVVTVIRTFLWSQNLQRIFKIAISKNFKNAIELKPPIYCLKLQRCNRDVLPRKNFKIAIGTTSRKCESELHDGNPRLLKIAIWDKTPGLQLELRVY